MTSNTTDKFWKCYNELPPEIKKKAKRVYETFLKNPDHPSLHFKQIYSKRSIYSVRISKSYRALGVIEDKNIIWFWIGSHSDYDKLIKKMSKS